MRHREREESGLKSHRLGGAERRKSPAEGATGSHEVSGVAGNMGILTTLKTSVMMPSDVASRRERIRAQRVKITARGNLTAQ